MSFGRCERIQCSLYTWRGREIFALEILLKRKIGRAA